MRRLLKRILNLRGNLGSLFGGGGGNQVANVQTPTFQQNQSFNTAQGNLATLGTNILSGNLPSYYSGLGKSNSPQFQALEANTIGQTNNASAQQAAASGTDRSGVAATAAASSLANTLPQMQYSDYLNAQQQQAGLLQLGAGVTQNVAANGLTDQAQLNNFDQQNFQDQFTQAQYNNQFNQNAAQQNGAAIGTGLQDLFAVGAAPFTGGASLGMLNFGNGSVGNSAGGTNNFSSLINGIGGMFGQSPSQAAMNAGTQGLTLSGLGSFSNTSPLPVGGV